MPKKREFLGVVAQLTPEKLIFTPHFFIRNQQRNVGKGRIEDFLFNQNDKLLSVDGDTSTPGLTRFRAYYKYAHRKYLLIVVDLMPEGNIRIVTAVISERKKAWRD